MGKYFNNETLDGLWARLVNSVKNLLNGKKTWVLTERADMGHLFIEDNHLKALGDPWIINTTNGESYDLDVN